MTGLSAWCATVDGDKWLPPSRLALAADVGGILVQDAVVRDQASSSSTWLASVASPKTTIPAAAGGALRILVDAVLARRFALGLSTPYIARHGTFDPDGPGTQRPTCAGSRTAQWRHRQGATCPGLALLRGATQDEIIGTRRRKMILEIF